jgi:CTP synthase (UTP-ammonia lyase)
VSESRQAKTPVVVFMPEINPEVMGGTMRLGQRATCLRHKVHGEESIASRLYGGADGTFVHTWTFTGWDGEAEREDQFHRVP